MLSWIVVLLTLLALRLWQVLPSSKTPRKQRLPRSICIILGSGGHTAEMLQLIEGLDKDLYQPRTFVVANTDKLSREQALASQDHDRQCQIYTVPRARSVGQAWSSVPLTVCVALFSSAKVLVNIMPDVILCNGPGSCVPLCLLAYIPRVLGLKSIRIVYVESFARVKSLSLTGRILYPFADLFLVQWPDLAKIYPRAVYQGVLV